MRFSKYSRQIFAKRFFSASPPPLEQEIKYSFKEFLQDYEKRTIRSQDALKESLQEFQVRLKESLQESQVRLKESLDTQLVIYKNDIKSTLEARIAQSESRTLRWIIGTGVFIGIEVWYQSRDNNGNNSNNRQSVGVVRGYD